MRHYKMATCIDNETVDELGSEVNSNTVWTYWDVFADAISYNMPTRAFINKYLEKIEGNVHITDGWHSIDNNTEVYIEEEMIIRATKGNSSASVYRWNKQYSSWVNACPIKYSTFCNGYAAGRYAVK